MRLKRAVPVLLILVVACTANQAYVTVGATVHGVDTAMSVWADYVVAQAKAAGVAPQAWNPAAQAKVKQAYSAYYDAAVTAKLALEATSRIPTPADLAAAASAVIDLVQQITGKMVTP